MKYYLFKSTLFVVFIAISAMAFSALPIMKNSFNDVSDLYIRSQMDFIQSEMLFVAAGPGTFRNFCSTGMINGVVIDLIVNETNSLDCRSNNPYFSKMIACARLKNTNYYCVDSMAIQCEIIHNPRSGYSCREI